MSILMSILSWVSFGCESPGSGLFRDGRLHDARHAAATVLFVLGVPERTVIGVNGLIEHVDGGAIPARQSSHVATRHEVGRATLSQRTQVQVAG